MTETTAICVAPNGARLTKADHPALPLTPVELAQCARACLDAGAAMIHLHVRDASDGHSLDPERYRRAISAVRAEVGERMVIQVTTEAVGRYAPQEQMDVVVDLQPEAVSLALRELCPGPSTESRFSRFMADLRNFGTVPQIILYSPDEVTRLADMAARGIVPEKLSVLYVLGRYTEGQRSVPSDLDPFVAAAQGRFPDWWCCAFGPREIDCLTYAASLGGRLRVGFENNLLAPEGGLARDNAAQVAALAARIAPLVLTDADGLRDGWEKVR